LATKAEQNIKLVTDPGELSLPRDTSAQFIVELLNGLGFMKMFTEEPEVFLYRDFVDFRKSMNGLSLIVEQQMQLSPLNGSVYVFAIKVAISSKVSVQ
jgi:hypothetical protein